MTNKNPFSNHFFLSGKRLVTSKRVLRTDIALGFLALTLFIVFTGLYPDDSGLVLLGLFVAWIVLILIRLARGETFFQLRLKEIESAKSDANKALEDLHKYANSLNEKSAIE